MIEKDLLIKPVEDLEKEILEVKREMLECFEKESFCHMQIGWFNDK